MGARFYKSAVAHGFRIQTDVVQVSMTPQEGKDVIEDVLRYMGITGPGVAITEENWAWMMKEEEGDNE